MVVRVDAGGKLRYAAYNGDLAKVKKYVEDDGVDVDDQDEVDEDLPAARSR